MFSEQEEELRNNEGCCCALIYKLRENRRVLVVSLLLLATTIAIAKGMYDGITMKEYSNVTIALGIFFPSIVMVIICIYIVIDYSQLTSSRISPAVHYSRNRTHSQSCEDIADRPERCLENRINVKVEHRLNVRGSPTVDQSRTSTVEIRRKEFRRSKENPPFFCKCEKCLKLSKSCSDPDISRHDHPNFEMANGGASCKKHENGEMAVGRCRCEKCDENNKMAFRGGSCKKHEHSQRCKENDRVLKPIIRFKRCLSDSSCKYKNAESEEKTEECNFKLADNLKRFEGKEHLKVQKQHSNDKEYGSRKSKENIKDILSQNNFYPPKNHNGDFRSSKNNATERDCMDGNEMHVQRDKRNYLRVDGYSSQNVTGENVGSPRAKHGISHLPKTCEGKRAHGEHRQPLHFSFSEQAQKDNIMRNRSEMNVFSTSETRCKQSNLCSSRFQVSENRQKCISSLQSIETKDHVKRQTIYFPSRSFNFLKYPGHARQEHSCLPRNDEMAMKLSSSKNENTNCDSLSEPKEKRYSPICNTTRLSPHTKENVDYYSMSDTRERKSPTICYVEKRLSSMNKGKSDDYSTKELSVRISPKSKDNINHGTQKDSKEKKSS